MGLVCLVVRFYKYNEVKIKKMRYFCNISNNFIKNRLKNKLYFFSLKLYYKCKKIETLYIIISTYAQQNINTMHASVLHIEDMPDNKHRRNFYKFQLFGY